MSQPEKGKIGFQMEYFDMGTQVGLAVTLPDGRRHAVMMPADGCSAPNAIRALADWIEKNA